MNHKKTKRKVSRVSQ